MNIEKIDGPIISARFHDTYKELVDIDFLFAETNKFYARYFLELGLTPSFDFSSRHDQKVYTNEFIKIICEFIKNRDISYNLFFYCNNTSKDKFRNRLVKKVKSVFGFRIWEDSCTLDEFITKVRNNDCATITGLEIFFDGEQRLKNFKQIKKNLKNLGHIYLNDVYFEELSMKMVILR